MMSDKPPPKVTKGRGAVANAAGRYAKTVHEAVEQGGAWRLLSRLHSALPRVPWLSGWVDPRQAVPLAERARSE